MEKNYVLKNPADFDNAILFQTPVQVWQNGEIIEYGGIIEEHGIGSVKIQGNYYLKSTCEFRVR